LIVGASAPDIGQRNDLEARLTAQEEWTQGALAAD